MFIYPKISEGNFIYPKQPWKFENFFINKKAKETNKKNWKNLKKRKKKWKNEKFLKKKIVIVL
jgi:hypothetical protein